MSALVVFWAIGGPVGTGLVVVDAGATVAKSVVPVRAAGSICMVKVLMLVEVARRSREARTGWLRPSSK